MKTIGIIAEYNPFHQGHAHHLEVIKKNYPDAVCIVVMAGAFVQRGGPAFLSKFDRATMAVQGGANLVIELPTLFATAHAQLFAEGGVRLLEALGVKTLSFGSEVADKELLQKVASIAGQDQVQASCRRLLNEGQAYGAALRQAIGESLPGAQAVLASPNALLGLEYIKAIQTYAPTMDILPIERHSDHHASELASHLPSGTALREAIYENGAANLRTYFPNKVFNLLKEALTKGASLNPDRYQDMVLAQARRLRPEELKRLQDFTEGLEYKWTKGAQAPSWQEGREIIKSKRYTYARLDRMAAYSLLGIGKDLIVEAQDKGPRYGRILAFDQKGRSWLSQHTSTLPLINKWAPFYKEADAFTKESLRLDALASDLQSFCFLYKEARSGGQDYRQSPRFIKS